MNDREVVGLVDVGESECLRSLRKCWKILYQNKAWNMRSGII